MPTVARIAEDNSAEMEGVGPELQNSLQHQTAGTFCKQTSKTVVQAKAGCTTDEDDLIVQVATIDEAVYAVVHQALWSCLLYHFHFFVVAGDRGQS